MIEQCGEILIFKTIRHSEHECIEVKGHADDSLNCLREPSKHSCLCGVHWTTNPTLGNRGMEGAAEVDITSKPKSQPGEEDESANYYPD